MGRFREWSGAFNAIQYTGRNAVAVMDLLGAHRMCEDIRAECLTLDLQERVVVVRSGEWVIRQDGGAFRIETPDQFSAGGYERI